MKPEGALKLVGEVRDLQIVDSQGFHCGIADDVELDGETGKELVLSALMVGPGAYEYRLPKWLYSSIRFVFGSSVVKIPWREIEHITGHITLKKPGASYGLLKVERRFAAIVGKIPYA